MSTNTKDRLIWLLDQLNQLDNGGNIRYDGQVRFNGARDELTDIINTYEDAAPVLPAPILTVMDQDQVDRVMAGYVAKYEAKVIDAIAAELQRSDVEVIAAVVQSGQDTVAALKPAQ